MEFKIRRAILEDADVLICLMESHAELEGAKFNRQGKKERLIDCLLKETVLSVHMVETNNEIIGYFSYTIDFSTWEADFYLHLDCLYLVEEARGKGIGSHIFKFLQKKANENQCFNIQWQTPVDNQKAINFYLQQGASSKTKERFTLSTK